MASVKEQIAQLEAGIAAEEALRATLGDAVVEASVAALSAKLDELRAQHDDSSEQLMGRLQSFLPSALAEKMQATGGIGGERKQVTVLAAEISGFSALGDRVSIANAVLKELAEAVYLYEGYVDQLAGDSVIAVFGAPVTHEDDAERALRAALELRERFERFNREWISRLGEPLTLHMGVNSGPVDAGKLGDDLRMAYTVVGDTVTYAARLQDVAEPGQILVSRSVHRLAGAAFTFVALEPIRVKDQREPLMVYELGRARLGPGKPRGLHDLATAFVGRDAEMAELQQVIADLGAGKGSVVAISGEAGIGKSRLMAEWRQEVEAGEHATWMEGRCLAHTGAVAYGPFLDLLRSHAGIRDEQTEETARWRLDLVVDRLFPEDEEAKALFANLLAFRLSPEESKLLKKIPGEQRRDRLFELTTQLFTLLADQGPILLVIEDMHWADATSLELVEHLLPLVSEVPLALVSVSRPVTEPIGPLKVAEARYAERFTAIALDRLPETGSVELVCQLLTVEECPAALRQLILERAEGVPFFVEELIRTLIERGALARSEDGVWQATPLIETITVPGNLQGLLCARLDRLPVETKALAQKASVIGRTFLDRVLRQLVEDEEDVDADLSEMERDNLIHERAHDPEVEYMFHHALTQEVAYESLLPSRRKDLHRIVGQAMETVFADRLAEFYAPIGRHYLKGGLWERAFKFLIWAGDLHAGLYANSEARKFYRWAEDAHGRLPDTEENHRQCVDLQVKICEVSRFSDQPEELLERAEKAEELAKELAGFDGTAENRLRLARVHYWLGLINQMRAHYQEALRYFEKVLPVAEEFNDRELLALPKLWKGQTSLLCGHLPEAEELIREALPTLKETGEWKDWVLGVAAHGMAVAYMGDPSKGIPEAQSAVDEARRKKALTVMGIALGNLTGAYLVAGDLESALKSARQQFEIAEQSGDKLTQSVAHGWLAWVQSRMAKQHRENAEQRALRGQALEQADFDKAASTYERAKSNMTSSINIADNLGKKSVGKGKKADGKVVLHDDWFISAWAEIHNGLEDHKKSLGLPDPAKLEPTEGSIEKAPPTFSSALLRRAWGQAFNDLAEKEPNEAETHLQQAEENLKESVSILEASQHRLEAARSRIALAEHYYVRNPTAAQAELEKALQQWKDSGLARTHEADRTRALLDGLKS